MHPVFMLRVSKKVVLKKVVLKKVAKVAKVAKVDLWVDSGAPVG